MKIPTKIGPLIALAETIVPAINLHQATTALPLDAGAVMDAAIANVRNAEATYGQSRSALADLRVARKLAQKEGDQFLAVTIQSLKLHLGLQWNGNWAELGFASGSLKIPEKRDERFGILSRLQQYLTAHPEQQVPPAGVTIEKSGEVYDRVVSTRAAVNEGVLTSKAAALALDQSEEVLQRRIRNTYYALEVVLKPDDPIWTAFGFPLPIAKSLPLVPKDLAIEQTGPGTILARWSRAVRAGHYRLFIQAEGDAEPRQVASVQDLLAEVSGLPAQVKLIFTVTAANSAGESLPSAPVEIILN